MIVEFIGTTGAGKTTLLAAVQSQLSQTVCVKDATGLVISRLGMQTVTNATLQNIAQELACFPLFLCSLPRHHAFIRQSIRLYSRNSTPSIASFNNLRSLERKIGTYEIARRQPAEQIILVDEGPLLAAHMFAFTNAPCTSREIADFGRLAPLPDLIIYVTAPMDVLIRRSLRRPDAPRQLRSKNVEVLQNCLRAAVDIFEKLINVDAICDRVLVVDNSDCDGQVDTSLVEQISRAILSHESGRMCTARPVGQIQAEWNS
jgi:thymidylate kinase